MIRPLSLLALALAGGILFSSCSSPQKRAEERATAFEKLSKDEQRLALQGKISEGMNEDAVYVALGRPNRIRKGNSEGVEETCWMYGQIQTDTSIGGSQVLRTSRGTYVNYDPAPVYQTYYVDTFQVTFREGKVVAWREL